MTAAGPAVLFDIDGTLVDTNWFHTLSWWRALREAGEQFPMARIHPLIGMGSDKLLTELLGEEREGLSDLHAKHYAPFKNEITAFAKAPDLLAAVAKRGATVVLASSSKEEDLDVLISAIGADDGVISEVVHGDMVEAGKPAPDIFATALDRLDLDPDRTMVVGDTRWDLEAAAKVGLRCAAVRSGGWTDQDLTDAGALAVYADVAELLDHLDDSPLSRLLQ